MGRVKNAVAKANQRITVQLVAFLLAGSTLLSSALGMFRERLLNGFYYETYPVGLDAYTAAFIVPDFIYFILVSGALSVTFIPVFNKRLLAGNKRSAWELSSSMINFMAIITAIFSVLIVLFADPIIRYIVAPDLPEAGRNLAISLMRVLAVNPFLFAVSAVIASMQQAVGRFTFYALAPTIYNVGIIMGILFFTGGIHVCGIQIFEGGIMGVALGVVLGAILQLIVSAIGLWGLGFDYRFRIYWKNKGFRDVLRILPARSIDQGADYVNSIVEINLASGMAEGTVRAYQQALTLHMFPVNLIGVAISTAAFPQMAEHLNEGRDDLFKLQVQSILRVIIWLALPVAVVAFFGRGYIVNFIMNGGDPLTAGLLGSLAIAILFRSIYHISARSFYAQQDTKTPLYISLFTIALNIVLAVWFIKLFNMGAYGLAWAQSVVAAIEVVILFTVMAKKIKGVFDVAFVNAVMRMILASVVTSIICYGSVQLLQLQNVDQSFFATFPKFALIVIVSGVVYLLCSHWLRLSEASPVLAKLRSLLFGRIR